MSPSGDFFFFAFLILKNPHNSVHKVINNHWSIKAISSLGLLLLPPPWSVISLQWKQALFLFEGVAFQVRQIKCWVLHNLIIRDSHHLPPVRVYPLDTVCCTYLDYILLVKHSLHVSSHFRTFVVKDKWNVGKLGLSRVT